MNRSTLAKILMQAELSPQSFLGTIRRRRGPSRLVHHADRRLS
jgi:hypothetical protein